MKKAELKKLKALIEHLPNIPIIQNGVVKTQEVVESGESLIRKGLKVDDSKKPIHPKQFYNIANRTHYHDKVKFFVDHSEKGFTAQQTVDLWNEKYRKTQEALVNHEPPKPQELKTLEQVKTEVNEANNKLLAKQGLL